VGEEPAALRVVVRHRHVPLAGVFGDRLRDGLVQTPVERLELVRRDVTVRLDRQLRDRLADVPVVVNDLRNRESGPPQVATVKDRALRHLVAGRSPVRPLFPPQRLRELFEENGHPVDEARVRYAGEGPGRDLHTGARDDLGAVHGEELVQHRGSV
jgi:hypothetical protein